MSEREFKPKPVDRRELAIAKQSVEALKQFFQGWEEEEKKGNKPFMVWSIPKSVIEEFNEKIVNPKCHLLGLSHGEVLGTEIMNLMLEAIKKASELTRLPRLFQRESACRVHRELSKKLLRHGKSSFLFVQPLLQLNHSLKQCG